MTSTTNTDLELGIVSASSTLRGYPSFAAFIEQDPDAAIYRKFEHLSARNLLYQQSELHALQLQLRELDRVHAKYNENEDARKAARDWSNLCDPSNPKAREHQDLQEKIKGKIREYRKH
jgi:Family of unknown function (DUF6594)